MINFRYHVVSLTAVFLALAIGLVVGTAALNGPVADALKEQVNALRKDNQQLRDQVSQPARRRSTARRTSPPRSAPIAARRQAGRPPGAGGDRCPAAATTPTGVADDAHAGRRHDHRHGRRCRTSSSTRTTATSCSTWPTSRAGRACPPTALPANSDGVETSSALLAAALLDRAPAAPAADADRDARCWPRYSKAGLPRRVDEQGRPGRPRRSWWSPGCRHGQGRRPSKNAAVVTIVEQFDQAGRDRGRRQRLGRRRQPGRRGPRRPGAGQDDLHRRQRRHRAGPGRHRAGRWSSSSSRQGRPVRRRRPAPTLR